MGKEGRKRWHERKGEMNERRGVEVGSWAGLCVSRQVSGTSGLVAATTTRRHHPCAALIWLVCTVPVCLPLCALFSSPRPLTTLLHLLFPFSGNR